MISTAFAQTTAPSGPAGIEGLLSGPFPLVIGMFIIMYFFMIRPQQKKAKEHKGMVDGLAKGDEVIAMGMIGKIVKVADAYVGLEVGDGKVIHIQKGAVTTLLPKGTFNDVTK